MGTMTVKCNGRQVRSILKDFEDASVPVETSYGQMHHGMTELRIVYDDQDDGIVEGIVKSRMKINEEEY